MATLPFNEQPLSIIALKPSHLSRIETFMLAGEWRQAYHYALDEKLWAHALLLAHGLDKDAWDEVVKEFMRSELGQVPKSTVTNRSSDNFDALRLGYGLFAGFGASSSKSGMVISKAT